MVTLANVFSWESFGKLLLNGYNNLSLPNSDNTSLLLDLVVFHAASDPFIFAVRMSLLFAFICWFQSMATGKHSWVDKIWSITPMIYAIHYSIRNILYWPKDEPYVHMPRVYIATLLIVVWGVRLTYNFYRKGGYGMDSEDYRWPFLGSIIPSILWLFFNIIFISLFQNLLLVALTAPVYLAWKACIVEMMPLNWIDAVATLLFIGGLTLETIADNQQWEFQESKKKAIANKENLIGDYKRGFLTQGLFKYSRHPNFFGEMIIWVSVYLFSIAAGYPTYDSSINPSIVGPAVLILLFQFSTLLTEYLSSQRYPTYKLYKKTTSRFIPLPAGASLDELEKKSQ
ncbi:hypothetical protein BGX21_001335 [Mortierella sp. AD011]|nr:hypothetical protein BGX20_009394 [Mortierella sp. AD010]KAF9384292.1 hypothetical protein BGX21_001335 [Mortierella sp. AD011]